MMSRNFIQIFQLVILFVDLPIHRALDIDELLVIFSLTSEDFDAFGRNMRLPFAVAHRV